MEPDKSSLKKSKKMIYREYIKESDCDGLPSQENYPGIKELQEQYAEQVRKNKLR